MVAIRRRRLCCLVACTSLWAAGCLSPREDGAADLVIINDTEDTRELSLQLEQNGDKAFEAEVAVPSRGTEPEVIINDVVRGRDGARFDVTCRLENEETYRHTWQLTCIDRDPDEGPKDSLYVVIRDEIRSEDAIEFDESFCG